jgi:uncharacterized damage-inducible protein DinB
VSSGSRRRGVRCGARNARRDAREATMEAREQLRLLAGYHGWASRQLTGLLRAVPDEDYRRDCGMFFRSIHGTLNHLLLADRLWYGRFTGQPIAVRGLDEELVGERDRLAAEIVGSAERWDAWLGDVPPRRFEGELAFVTTEGTPRSMPFAATLAHVFNHGTHHRGQISAALTALGHGAPEIDLYYYLLHRQSESGVTTLEALHRYLQSKFAQLDEEISHYPSPIARCDEQLTKLIEQRAEVLTHLRRLQALAGAGGAQDDAGAIYAGILAAAVYDDAQAEALRRGLPAG